MKTKIVGDSKSGVFVLHNGEKYLVEPEDEDGIVSHKNYLRGNAGEKLANSFARNIASGCNYTYEVCLVEHVMGLTPIYELK